MLFLYLGYSRLYQRPDIKSPKMMLLDLPDFDVYIISNIKLPYYSFNFVIEQNIQQL